MITTRGVGKMFQKMTVALTALCVLVVLPLCAQGGESRRGFWLSFGGGGGWNDGMRGASGYVRMGGTPNERVQFGTQLLWWWRHEPNREWSRVHAGVTAQFFPFRFDSHGASFLNELHLRTGFGYAGASDIMSGVGIQLGVGCDLGLNDKLFVTPSVDVLKQMYRHLTDTALLFTLGLTWH
jgi:hypothetical protein